MIDSPVPPTGRVFRSARRVRLGDSSPGGRLRLDAVARMLHDVSDDDTRDAGLAEGSWVVRRTTMAVVSFPVYLEPLALTTWCAGLGQRWAERRTIIVGEHGGRIDAATLWVHVDPTTMRPARLPAQFADLFAESALGRTVSARLDLPAPDDMGPSPDARPWPARLTDFDVLGHVNNAIAWAMLEELLADRRDLRAPLEAVVEYAAAVERADVVTLTTQHSDAALAAWATVAAAPPRADSPRADSPGDSSPRPAISLMARRITP